MVSPARGLRQEFRPMFLLAVPVVLAELGWMAMGMVDTLMVGRISPEAIGAVGVGTSLFMAITIFPFGLLLGLDTLVSQAFGGGKIDECHRWLLHGLVVSLVLSVPSVALLMAMTANLEVLGLSPGVLELTRPYLGALAWSAIPLLLYGALRRYLQGMGQVRPVMIALLSANIVNVAANWVLVYGNLGFPAMGVRGSAWATVFARAMMMLYLVCTIVYREWGTWRVFDRLQLEWAWFRQLVRLGTPAATQWTLEVGAFATVTALAGGFAPAALAAHQIALNYAGLTFMVPLGLSSAGAVRVGHAVGRGDPAGAARAGWTALLFGMLFMSAAALIFLLIPRPLLAAFTSDAGVLAAGVPLLFVAALFQLFDGMQSVATGALRGLGDTRSPMFWNLGGHWFVGLPFGYFLAFSAGFGVIGLWWGFLAGLVVCGAGLLAVWMRRIKQFERSGTVIAAPVAGG